MAICKALVAAACRLSTTDNINNPRQLVRIDGTPVIIHILRGLQGAGIRQVVITLGHSAQLLAKEVLAEDYGSMTVELVWCQESSWKRGHASNILAARSMFSSNDPFLIVMSDHIYDPRLMVKLASYPLAISDACVLVDDSAESVEWASPGGAHCKAYCRFGHCGSLVKVLKGEGDRASRIGKKLAGFDALEAGAFVARPDLFEVLHQLLADSIYCTLADAMDVFAADGRLRYLAVDGLEWFGQQTIASLPMDVWSSAVAPEWRQRALLMLGKTSPRLVAVSAVDGSVEPLDVDMSIPLYELGRPIGTGCSSVVVEGKRQPAASNGRATSLFGSFGNFRASENRPLGVGAPLLGSTPKLEDLCEPCTLPVYGVPIDMGPDGSGGMQLAVHPQNVGSGSSARLRSSSGGPHQRGLAVKVIRKGEAEALGLDERSVMWEVHVLKKLDHPNIVRVMDVIEVIDATYIIMDVIDGPELTDFIHQHPGHRLPPKTARVLFCHVLSGLRHAHQRGFLHCDVKPDNVRLYANCETAVLTDWGFARQPGTRTENYMCGTPAYASPEQLTGYSPDSVTGRHRMCPATDVWSLGVTYFEMVSGVLPFVAEDIHALIRMVMASQYTVPDHVEADDATLIDLMLHLLPHDRATVAELCEHPVLLAANAITLDSDTHKVALPAEDGKWPQPDMKEGAAGTLASLGRSKTAKKLLWLLFYGGLCALALWSHLNSPEGETISIEATAH